MNMNDLHFEAVREKARQKRYKKPIHAELNIDTIKENLWEIRDECSDVQWFFEGGDDDLLESLIGTEDNVQEFKLMFSDLSNMCEQMLEDLDDEWIPEFFNIFMVSNFGRGNEEVQICGRNMIVGWDSYDEDYMGISDGYEVEMALEEARKKMMRFTKEQILEGGRRCFRVTLNYISLKSRYEDLKASMDIIREKNKGELDILKNINNLYEKANEVSDGFKYIYQKEVDAYNKYLGALDPYSRLWLE